MSTIRRGVFSPPEAQPDQERHTRDAWRRIGNQHSLQATVKELGTKVQDFDERLLNLHHCEYKIGAMELTRLVKKGMDDEALRQSYSFTSSFRHPAAVIVENYLGKGSIIMSMVDGSFHKWLKSRPASDLFTNGSMRPLLRNMIIDLAEVIQAVHGQNMHIVNLSIKDLYVKILSDGTPRLQVLITNARKASAPLKARAWDDVKATVQGCFSELEFKPNEVTRSFCSSISSKPSFLKKFPDQWDSSMKSRFLMETCAYKVLSSSINQSKLMWPEKDGNYEPLVLILIELGKEHAKYEFAFPNDYVRLCRNTKKHFLSLPPDIRSELGGTPDGFLLKMEEWTPNIWDILYKAIEQK
uniref:Uncharacterized protein n=1 Tax=Avena sativa TaxID=4498 RepID=A0ACD5U728_AVESA